MQADESKVKALASIFGGQDITTSVIRTVLSSTENKFDEAVDSLLNMSTGSRSNETLEEEADEDALLDKKEREKVKTLEGMFGNDLSMSVICTVLESNKGELVDTVDTLLNMTSGEINPRPNVGTPNERESERRQMEEEMNNYEEFKRLQIQLQEEEARAVREQQRRAEEELRLKAEAELRRKSELEAEERKQQEMLREQEKALRAYELQKKKQDAGLEERQEQLRREWEKKLKLLHAEEENMRAERKAEDAKRKAEEESRHRELLAKEEALRRKAQEQEELLARFRAQEEMRMEEMKRQLEASRLLEQQKAEEAARLHQEVLRREAERNMLQQTKMEELLQEKMRVCREAEAREQKKKIEEEMRAQALRLEEERADHQRRLLEEERLALQKEKQLLEAKAKEQQRILEEARLAAEVRPAPVELPVSEEPAKQEVAVNHVETEKQVPTEEVAQPLLQSPSEEQPVVSEPVRPHIIPLEQLNLHVCPVPVDEEERLIEQDSTREIYDQLAASVVFVPPKEEAVAEEPSVLASVMGADIVSCTWNIPAEHVSPINWLGLYPVHQPFNTKKYVQFAYTNGASNGQHIFRGVTPGHYEVRFFVNRGYEHAARSVPVRVGPSAAVVLQLQGDHLLVHYVLDPISSTPTREWLGIYEKTQRRNKLYLSTAYGNAEGQVMMKAPRTPGVYEVRLFCSGAGYNDQARSEFVVEDNDLISCDVASVVAGGSVNVRWVMRTVETSSGDWIGLYRADEANNSNYLLCTYTQALSVGTAAVTVPKEAGVYELRLFARAKGKYTTFRTSPPLTVV